MQTQWFSGLTQTVASLLCSLASPCLLLLFMEQHRTPLSPEEKEQNLQEEHRGSVVLLYTGKQHPFDWEPEVRAGLQKRTVFFGVCVCVFVHVCDYMCVGICMCFSLRVYEGLFANVTVKPQTFFFGSLKSHDSVVYNLFICTVSYSICLCWCVISPCMASFPITQFLFIPHCSVSGLSTLKPVNKGSTLSLIRLRR